MFFLPLGFIYFFNLFNFYPVTLSRVTPLLVTRYSLLRQLCLVTPLKKTKTLGQTFTNFNAVPAKITSELLWFGAF